MPAVLAFILLTGHHPFFFQPDPDIHNLLCFPVQVHQGDFVARFPGLYVLAASLCQLIFRQLCMMQLSYARLVCCLFTITLTTGLPFTLGCSGMVWFPSYMNMPRYLARQSCCFNQAINHGNRHVNRYGKADTSALTTLTVFIPLQPLLPGLGGPLLFPGLCWHRFG